MIITFLYVNNLQITIKSSLCFIFTIFYKSESFLFTNRNHYGMIKYIVERRIFLKKLSYLIILLIIPVIVSACSEDTTNDDKIVYTSIYPIQYIVEEIGGDVLDVQSVYPPGVDAHSYEPSSREMTEIARGEAFIYLGAGMESFAETAADSLKEQNVKLLEIAKLDDSLFHSAEAMNESEEDHHHSDLDPHIWFDPVRMVQMGDLILNELTEMFPEDAEELNANNEEFKKNMSDLDEEYAETLQSKDNKKVLVAHAAYGYLEERYGIEQIAISGLSTNDEPSQKDLTQTVNIAKENDLNYVIFEQSGTDKVSDIIKEQIHAEPLYMHNLESLTEEDIENGDDYLSLMKKNLAVLDQATTN